MHGWSAMRCTVPMVHDQRPAPRPSSHPKLRHRTLVAGSFGKLFHATGWKIGWLAAPADVTRELRKVHPIRCVLHWRTHPGGTCDVPPNRRSAEPPRQRGAMYQEKRDRLLRGLQGTGLTWTPAEGGYFQVVGVQRYLKPGETDGDLARRWTREHGVATIPMGAFGNAWEPAVRLVFCQRKRHH